MTDMDLQQLNGRITDHIDQDKIAFDGLNKTLTDIKENHLAHIQASMAQIEERQAVIKNNVSWLLKILWSVATPLIAAFVGTIWYLIIHH